MTKVKRRGNTRVSVVQGIGALRTCAARLRPRRVRPHDTRALRGGRDGCLGAAWSRRRSSRCSSWRSPRTRCSASRRRACPASRASSPSARSPRSRPAPTSASSSPCPPGPARSRRSRPLRPRPAASRCSCARRTGEALAGSRAVAARDGGLRFTLDRTVRDDTPAQLCLRSTAAAPVPLLGDLSNTGLTRGGKDVRGALALIFYRPGEESVATLAGLIARASRARPRGVRRRLARTRDRAAPARRDRGHRLDRRRRRAAPAAARAVGRAVRGRRLPRAGVVAADAGVPDPRRAGAPLLRAGPRREGPAAAPDRPVVLAPARHARRGLRARQRQLQPRRRGRRGRRATTR